MEGGGTKWAASEAVGRVDLCPYKNATYLLLSWRLGKSSEAGERQVLHQSSGKGKTGNCSLIRVTLLCGRSMEGVLLKHFSAQMEKAIRNSQHGLAIKKIISWIEQPGSGTGCLKECAVSILESFQDSTGKSLE